jgi:predicted permease
MPAGAWCSRWPEKELPVELLSHILAVTFPFFALVLCGYAAARRGWVPLETIPGLNFFVLYLALPAMLFRFAASTPIASLLDTGTVLSYVVCALSMLALTVATTRTGPIGWNDASFGALVAAFPNSGFMGVPLLVALLGTAAAAPSIVALSLDMVLTSSLCIALSRLDGSGASGAGRAMRQALRGMAVNPLPWAIFSGSLLSASHQELPAAATSIVTMLAQSASPVALFTLGCVLARTHKLAQATARPKSLPANPAGATDAAHPAGSSDVGRIVAYKLLLHPLLVFCVGQLAMRLGVPLDPFSAMVLVLVAALPSASNVPMLAERFGADAGRLARAVMLSTAIAFLTFSLAVVSVVPESALLQARGR